MALRVLVETDALLRRFGADLGQAGVGLRGIPCGVGGALGLEAGEDLGLLEDEGVAAGETGRGALRGRARGRGAGRIGGGGTGASDEGGGGDEGGDEGRVHGALLGGRDGVAPWFERRNARPRGV